MPECRQMMETPMHIPEIARAFVQTTMDLETTIYLDGIEPGTREYRIRCHDQHGMLPEIMIPEEEENRATLQHVRHSACKLAAITRIRDEIACRRPGVSFGSEVTRKEVDSILDGYRKLRNLLHKI
jgi:hypothetical protein